MELANNSASTGECANIATILEIAKQKAKKIKNKQKPNIISNISGVTAKQTVWIRFFHENIKSILYSKVFSYNAYGEKVTGITDIW